MVMEAEEEVKDQMMMQSKHDMNKIHETVKSKLCFTMQLQ